MARPIDMSEDPIVLPGTEAICINVGTAPVTAIALLSLRRFFPGRIRLVECSHDQDEKRLMRRLAEHLELDYEDRPLKPHGETLDSLFRETRSEALLLVDSDLELLGARTLSAVATAIAEPRLAGAGFLQPGAWAVEAGMSHAWYAARLWMPLAWFRAEPVRRVLGAGESFRARRTPNDVASWPRLSALLALRSRLPGLRRLSLGFLRPWRERLDGVLPSFVYHDTGADVYQGLCARGDRVATLDWAIQDGDVTHLHGVSRSRLAWLMPNAVSWRQVRERARLRLGEEYADQVPADIRF